MATQDEINNALKNLEIKIRTANAAEDKLQVQELGKQYSRLKAMKQPEPSKEEPVSVIDKYLGDISSAFEQRGKDFTATTERLQSGETDPASAMLQTANALVVGPALDVAGLTIMAGIKAVVPDATEELIERNFKEVMGKEWPRKIMEAWDGLDPDTKATLGAVGNFAAVLTPKLVKPSKVVPRPDKIRRGRLTELFSPPATKGSLEEAAKRLGATDPYVDKVLDTVNNIKGIDPVGPNKHLRNMKVINKELDGLEAQLTGKLKQVKTPLRAGVVKQRINQAADSFDPLLMQSDSAIDSAFNLSKKRMDDLIDKYTVEGGISASDLLKARRAFDKLQKPKKGAYDSPQVITAKESAKEVIRNTSKEILGAATKDNVGINTLFEKYSHTLSAQKNLAANTVENLKGLDWAKSQIKRHPIIALGVITGGGGAYLQDKGLLTAAAIMGGAYGASRAYKAGASRPVVAKPIASLASGVETARQAIPGPVRAVAASPILPRAGMMELMNRPQEQQNGQP